MNDALLQSWNDLIRIAVVGTLGYAGLVVILRAAGRRTLSKMNAFDLVVTVALGSILATTMLSRDVALLDGLLAVAVLVVLQFGITWASVRAQWVRRLVTGEPMLLFSRGDYLPGALRSARVTRDEIRMAVRAAGIGDLASVSAVVLETDGSLSVLTGHGATVLTGVRVDHAAAMD